MMTNENDTKRMLSSGDSLKLEAHNIVDPQIAFSSGGSVCPRFLPIWRVFFGKPRSWDSA